MKGKTLVISIVLFVLIVVGAIYFAMMSTINKIKKENDMVQATVLFVAQDEMKSIVKMT